ncbi:myb-like protein X isoform X3 [Contarinia nasturtii]|nr:myb-like protein X isoform X3 [Contarinia nasturtii]
MEEIDRNRKKSKTFSEMMEERESKGRKCSLPVYNDDEDASDFNGFGYRASDTINGIGSVSEDYENQSVNSDNTLDSDKNRFIDGNSNHRESYRRDSESSPGFDDNTSNSTLSAASPDPVYSSSYNSNGSRTQITTLTSNFSRVSVESWAEKHHAPPSSNHLKPKPRLTPKIEGHLASYETKFNDSNADQDERNANVNADKIDLPKIDISSRRELFEKEQKAQFNRSNDTKKSPILLTENAEAPASIKERLSHLEKRNDEPKEMTPTKPNRYSGDFSGVRERFLHTENGQFVTIEPKAPKIDVPVVPLKERLMSLESSMVNETPTSNGKLEHRTKKMAEPKSITLNKVADESNLKVIDNNNESTTSSPIHVDESHHMKDDEDSGINSDDLQSSLASQQSQPQQMADECVVINRNVAMAVPRNEKPNEPVPAARKPEVMPRRQITPDLVKITTNSNIEDDLLQSQDEIDDEADNSVIDALDIALNAIDTEKPNELINIATSFDEIYEEINEFKPLKATKTTTTTTTIARSTIAQTNKEKATAAAAVESVNVTKTSESNPCTESNENGKTIDEPYYQVPKKQNESYYEVPKSRPIPVYENVDMYYDSAASSQKLGVNSVTKLPVPLEIGSKASIMQPPKEKPPPPPIETNDDEEESECAEEEPLPQDAMKRINSTKRIKKEIRNKRSSFLGIEGNDDESFLQLSVAPPPNMAALLQEERRIDKQLYMKAGLYDSSDTAESRDSGVSENHSRQSSEPVTSSSEEQEQDSNRPEIISALEKDKKLIEAGKNALAMECRALGTQQWVYNDGFAQNDDDIDPILKALDERERARCIDEQNCEQADILRVERELLQLEQEEMKRKNMMNRKLYEQQQRLHAQQQHEAQQQQQHQQHQQQQLQQEEEVELRRSLQDINGNVNLYANVYNTDYHVQANHRKSMPNLQDMTLREVTDKIIPPIPPAKPLRVQEYLKYGKQIYSNGAVIDPRTNQSVPMHLNTIHSQSNEDFRPYAGNSGSSNNSINGSYSNMTRHTLHALSAAPKPKFQDTWAHNNNNNNNNNNYENTNDNGWNSNRDYIDPAAEPYIRSRQNKEPIGDTWLSLQKRRSDPQNFNYNKHWLIQEAEQRRIDQARRGEWSQLNNSSKIIPRKGSNDNKPLPDAVIQTITQRVQNKLSDKKRLEIQQNHYHYHHHPHQTLDSSNEQLVSPQHLHNSYHQTSHQLNGSRLSVDELNSTPTAPREILSVSGKKKCSYCCEELGRGAAMIIESLRLFYHLDCFKCCVCRVQLGDGVSGADVRVRNQKLHCNNCFSSDDGVKFSCV